MKVAMYFECQLHLAVRTLQAMLATTNSRNLLNAAPAKATGIARYLESYGIYTALAPAWK